MNKHLIVALLSLSACANGQPYKESNAKLIIYRPDHFDTGYIKSAPLTINGKNACHLSNGGYYESNETGLIEASLFGDLTTSRIVSKGRYVRVRFNQGMANTVLFGGLAGDAMYGEGSFIFENVDAATARKELAGLKQDCV